MPQRAGLSAFLFLSLASLGFVVHRRLQSPDGAPLYVALSRLVYGRHEWHPATAYEAAGAQLLRESQEGHEGAESGAEGHEGYEGAFDRGSPGHASFDVATLPDGSIVPLVRERALFSLEDATEVAEVGEADEDYYSQHERALAANSAASRKVGGKGSFSGALATKRKSQYMLDTKGRIFDRYPSCGVRTTTGAVLHVCAGLLRGRTW